MPLLIRCPAHSFFASATTHPSCGFVLKHPGQPASEKRHFSRIAFFLVKRLSQSIFSNFRVFGEAGPDLSSLVFNFTLSRFFFRGN